MLEQKDVIEISLLKPISNSLKIPVEAFQNFDEEQAVNIISNTFSDFKDGASAINLHPVFNPMQEVLKLQEEKIALFENEC